LTGLFCYIKDIAFGQLLLRFRNGVPTAQDFETINSRGLWNGLELPDGIWVACSTNAQQEAINTGIWLRHLEQFDDESGTCILADNIQIIQNGQKKQ
jgi:hypothetical protein